MFPMVKNTLQCFSVPKYGKFSFQLPTYFVVSQGSCRLPRTTNKPRIFDSILTSPSPFQRIKKLILQHPAGKYLIYFRHHQCHIILKYTFTGVIDSICHPTLLFWHGRILKRLKSRRYIRGLGDKQKPRSALRSTRDMVLVELRSLFCCFDSFVLCFVCPLIQVIESTAATRCKLIDWFRE